MSTKMSMRNTRTRTFSGAARSAQKRSDKGSRGGGIIDGLYNRFTPNATPIWLHFMEQSYSYKIYDLESKKVIEVEDNFFLEFVQHFVANSKTSDKRRNRKGISFVCSSGAEKEEPCYGCAGRHRYYSDKQAREDAGEVVKGESPVSAGRRFGLALAVAELVAHVPLLDAKGQVRKKKDGSPIYNQIPLPRLREQDPDVVDAYRKTFGWNGHWNFSGGHLQQLSDIDNTLRNRCGNCASHLYGTGWFCNECNHFHPEQEALQDIDLEEARKAVRKCAACGNTDSADAGFTPELMCGDCGDAIEGGLVGFFDIRMKAKDSGAENQSSILELLDVRPTLSLRSEPEYEEFAEMVKKPIDIQRVFAPESLDEQRKKLDQAFIEGLDPAHTKWIADYNETETENLFEE